MERIPVIRTRNLSIGYVLKGGHLKLVHDALDLNLYPGEVTCLLGLNGAGRWRLMWHITLPAIRGTVVIMLIMKCGSILNTGFEQIYLMKNDLNAERAQVFDTYIYERGIVSGQYSVSAAAGLFKSIVSLILVLSANKIAKLCGESGFY